jgi:predicted RNA-binding protein YlqC (UPF0109 family)
MTETESQPLALLRLICSSIGTKGGQEFLEADDRTIKFWVHPEEHGKFVGKMGRCISAIQTIMWYATVETPHGAVRAVLEEPRTPNPRKPSPIFKPNPDWDRNRLGKLVSEILEACIDPGTASWNIFDHTKTEAKVEIQIIGADKHNFTEPDFEAALQLVLHSAGMAMGASIRTELEWR